jgi:NAD(P)H-nitrite reductase large subunit
MDHARVNRCICFRRSFAELKQIAQAKGAKTVEELQQHALFGRSCLMCLPYVEYMLATGETEVPLGPPRRG